jgi:hypothetical protein
VALRWLWGAYPLAINTLWGGFDVALGGDFNSSFIIHPSSFPPLRARAESPGEKEFERQRHEG